MEVFSLDYRTEAPELLRNFLVYHETILGHSRRTVDEYYLDLRNFFRYLKIEKGLVPRDTELDKVSIEDVNLDFIRSVKLSDIYEYLAFLAHAKEKRYNSPESGYGLSAKSRARKIATIRSFYKYLTVKTKQLDTNPIQDLDSPKVMKTLPAFLSLNESENLLNSVNGRNAERDYCILTLFLNCGLRISEVVGLNLADVREDHLRVLGKGNKVRVVFLNDACVGAINAYLAARKDEPAADKRAMFLSSRHTRISKSTVHSLVKKHLLEAGLDTSKYSAHKLRHTAATLMLKNGVDIRTLQELLGHENLNTTQIYTHVENDSLRQAAQRSPLAEFKKGENIRKQLSNNDEEVE